MGEKMSGKDYLNLALEAGVASIPNFGPALQVAYFGRKNELRIKRIEHFYSDLADRVSKLEALPVQDEIDRDQLMGIIESINDEIETARAQSKRRYYENLYLECLESYNHTSWDQQEYFVDLLSRINDTQILLLNMLNQSRSTTQNKQVDLGVPQQVLEGNLTMLSDFGLVQRKFDGISIGGANSGDQYVYSLSTLGIRFVESVLTDSAE